MTRCLARACPVTRAWLEFPSVSTLSSVTRWYREVSLIRVMNKDWTPPSLLGKATFRQRSKSVHSSGTKRDSTAGPPQFRAESRLGFFYFTCSFQLGKKAESGSEDKRNGSF